MHIYEYLFSAIIIVTMIVASTFMVQTLATPHVKVSEKEQLKVVAETILNQILFESGTPSDWGSNPQFSIQNLDSFGLAKYNETTRGAYILDSDKILKLAHQTSTDPMVRQKVTELLNLGHDYGIALKFTTPLIANITHNPTANTYNLLVTSQLGGLPICSAKVNATLFYAVDGEIASQEIANSTDMAGSCLLDFEGLPNEAALVVVVDYFNIHVVKVFVNSPSYQTPIFGNQVYIDEPLNGRAYQAIVTKNGENWAIKTVNSTLTPQQENWYQVSAIEPSMAAILAVTNQGLVCASKDVSNAEYSSISVNFSDLTNPLSYSIERTVTINNQAYLMTLYIWRMSY